VPPPEPSAARTSVICAAENLVILRYVFVNPEGLYWCVRYYFSVTLLCVTYLNRVLMYHRYRDLAKKLSELELQFMANPRFSLAAGIF